MGHLIAGRKGIVPLIVWMAMALTLSACGSNSGPPSAPAEAEPGAPRVVRMNNFRYVPEEIRVKVGTPITFVNDDNIAHDVVYGTPDTMDVDEPLFQSPPMMPGAAWTVTFNKPGTYPILCTVGAHYLLGMTAEIIVEP